MKLFIKISVLLCMLEMSTTSRISISEDRGYRGIVVRIKESVRRESCAEVITNLKKVLMGTSERLFRASGGQAWLAQVSIVVPTLWTDNNCRLEINYPQEATPYKGSDIEVVGDDRIYGSHPSTKQYNQCGEPGEKIRLSEQFILDLNRTEKTWGNPVLLLLNEWTKYRYGVFDDLGYPDDPLYPGYLHDAQDRVLVTGTTNAMIRGAWTLASNRSLNCDPRSEKGCLFYPDESRNSQIACSISTLPFLSGVKDWCTPDEAFHPASPSKHNILCKGRSVHEVIHGHKDFKKMPSSNTAAERKPKIGVTEFNVIRQPFPEYVILLETSVHMKQVWKWVRKGLQNLIRFELPENSRVAIVTFNSEAKVEQHLQGLTTESARVRLADTIPDNQNKLSNKEDRCVSCAVQVAMNEVLRGQEAGGHIIVVTQGDAQTLSTSGEAIISEYEAMHSIRFSNILIPLQQNQDPLPFYSSISQISGGLSFTLTSNTGIYLLSDMIRSLRSIVSLDSSVSHTLHTNKIKKLPGTTSTTGEFFLDSFLGRDTRFGIFVEDEEEHGILSINLTDSCGNTYGPYTKMSSDFDIINFKTINFLVGDTLPFQEIGRGWRYEIQWLSQPKTTNNVIVVTSKHRTSDSSSHLKTRVSVTSTFPYILYVHVEEGDIGVVDAEVEVSGEYHGPDGPQSLGTLIVPDDGSGDPDIQRGDGVYSRYITWSPGHGNMKLRVRITDNTGDAYTITPGPSVFRQPPDLKIPVCCGSSIQIPSNRQKRMDAFEREHSITVRSVPPQNQDTIPPAKISDFQALVHENGNISMAWTAVGGDKLDGQTEVYRLHFTKNISSFVMEESTEFIEFAEYAQSGERVTYSISMIEANQPFYGYVYLAIQAGDLNANFGRFSNFVLLDFGDSSTVYSTQPSGIESIISEDWTLIGGIVGVILILVLSLVAVIISLMCSKRRNISKGLKKTRSSGVNVHIPSPSRSDATEASYDSDHQLVPPMNKPPSSTSFAANLTPTYWSASQLLSHHEKRTATLNRDKSKNGTGNGTATNNNQYNVYSSDGYDGYTITPLHDAPKASIYGSSADYSTAAAAATYGYGVYGGGEYAGGVYTGPAGGDYTGRTSALSPRNIEEFSHLDYGVVSPSDLEYASGEEEAGTVKPSDNSSSTLPTFTASIRGSTLSLNSAKKKNITQAGIVANL